MSVTWDSVRTLVSQRNVRISQHAYQRMAKRGILVGDIMVGAPHGIVAEDYPNFHEGPSVLVLQHDAAGSALHMWSGASKPARWRQPSL